MKKRLVGLDLLRIVSAFVVFLFHMQMHMGAKFGIFSQFIQMGAIFMTAFFMLSGYTLYYIYNAYNLMELKTLKLFYVKRLISIMPMYWGVAFVYDFFFVGIEYFKEAVMLIPVEILGIQTVFHSLFSFGHNGGTWFVSCILISYLFFPFFQGVVKQLPIRGKFFIILSCILILDYAPFIVKKYGVGNIYSNPFFRGLEFLLGICLASLYIELKDKLKCEWLFTMKCAVAEFVLLVVLVTICMKFGWNVNNYMMYNLIGLPCFGLMLWSLSGIKCIKIENSMIIRYLSNISYTFFLAQFFTWRISKYFISIIKIDNNIFVIIISFIVCSSITILLYEISQKLLHLLLSSAIMSNDKKS